MDNPNNNNIPPIDETQNQQSTIQDQINNPSSGNNIIDGFFGLLDRLFRDANGKTLMQRVLVLASLFLMALVWVKGDIIIQAYKDSRYDTYSKLVDTERNNKFEYTAKDQIQILQGSSKADLAAIYSFRPKDMNYFVDMVTYQGMLPQVVDPKNLGGYPIDKQSQEYNEHITGSSFTSTTDFVYLPTKEKANQIKYMYSCPLFNLENVYSGSIEMYWYNNVPVNEDKKLFLICNQVARVLGRVR